MSGPSTGKYSYNIYYLSLSQGADLLRVVGRFVPRRGDSVFCEQPDRRSRIAETRADLRVVDIKRDHNKTGENDWTFRSVH